MRWHCCRTPACSICAPGPLTSRWRRCAGRAGSTVIGVDFAGEMLRLGLAKVRGAGPRAADPAGARRRGADSARGRRRATAATIAFGIRNVAEPGGPCVELARVLGPAAGSPSSSSASRAFPASARCYDWYFRYLLPLVGRMVSKHQSAYSYLPASVGAFPPPAEFLQMCESSGFTRVRAVPLTFGIVYLYVAETAGPSASRRSRREPTRTSDERPEPIELL